MVVKYIEVVMTFVVYVVVVNAIVVVVVRKYDVVNGGGVLRGVVFGITVEVTIVVV